MGKLSGGNQQKVLFGRSLRSIGAGILLLNEPTRGVDVGARAEIYRLMRQLGELGYTIVLTTSDLEEACRHVRPGTHDVPRSRGRPP